MKHRLAAIAVLAGALPAMQLRSGEAGGNFHNVPEVRQTVTVEFATPGAAAKAALELCKLPDDRKIAFTVRADDANPRHQALAQRLQKYGFKAGMLLNTVEERFVPQFKEALKAGTSAGNHTRDHLVLPELMPNSVYDQIVIHQAEVESKLDTCSVSFTLPFCHAETPLDPKAVTYLAEALRRAGIFASTEGSNPYHFPEAAYFSSLRMRWFQGADSNPDPDAMEKSYQEAVAKAVNDPQVPRISYGMHTQYSDIGFDNLEKWLARHRNDADLWKCNENEYGAYRYSFHRANPTAKVTGKTVKFTLNRISAADLGSDIPLSVRFSEKPQKASIDGTPLTPSANGIYHLPAVGTPPKTVGRIDGSGNCEKFPGLSGNLEFDRKANRLTLTLTNRTGKMLNHLTVRALAPLFWESGIYPLECRSLPDGQSVPWTIDLGPTVSDPLCAQGDFRFLARCDFELGGRAARLYVDGVYPNPVPEQDCPRDRARWVGPVPNEKITPELLASLSMPSAPLPPFGKPDNEKWTNINRLCPIYREFLINARYPSNAPGYGTYFKETRQYFGNRTGVRLFVMEFIAPAAGKATLVCRHWQDLTGFHLNGKPGKFSWKNQWVANAECPIDVNQGVNRLLIVNPVKSDWQAMQLGVPVTVRQNDRNLHVSPLK